MGAADSHDEATLLFWKRYNAAARVRAMARLEQAIGEAQQAAAAIDNDMPAAHPARELLAQIKSKLYANVDGKTSGDGSLFTLAANLELLSRLE